MIAIHKKKITVHNPVALSQQFTWFLQTLTLTGRALDAQERSW
jgi:predicted outer membrane protein